MLRDDDQPETVQKRLNVYHEQTQPLIDYYTKEGILKSVDGTKDLEEVFDGNNILKKYLQILLPSWESNWVFLNTIWR